MTKESYQVHPLPQTDLNARAALRKRLRAARKRLSNDAKMAASLGIIDKLQKLAWLEKPSCVAVYLENDGEVDLQPFVEHCWHRFPKILFTLPVLHPVCKGHLLFLRYNKNTLMVQNKYKISEPRLACQDVIPTSDVDVILMPLVGFDKLGNRLGMGGGYYDRTLAFTQHANKKPLLIGIAHDLQEVNTLPTAPWDIPLDAIVTPTRILRF